MELGRYVEDIQHQLVVAAEAGGDDARALAQRLLAPLDAAIRLTLQDALAVAAEQITCELAPGSVELRVRDGELEFVVAPAPADTADDLADDDRDDIGATETSTARGVRDSTDGDDGGVSRINLRMPESLKARVERAAGVEGLSVNSWLVRAAAATLERADSGRPVRNVSRGKQRYTGWAR